MADDIYWLRTYNCYNAAGGTRPMTGNSSSESRLELQGWIILRCKSFGQNESTRIDETSSHAFPYQGGYKEALQRLAAVDIEIEPSGYFKRIPKDMEAEHFRSSAPGHHVRPGRAIASRRRFFMTRKGMIGVGSIDLRAGDTIWVLLGGKMPFVLRPAESKGEVEENVQTGFE